VGAVVLDAGVVIAWFDADDVHHAGSTAALHSVREEELRLPASAYAEALVRHAVAGSVAAARARIDASRYGSMPSVPTRPRPQPRFVQGTALRLPDALVLGYAEVIDADVVLTTDRRWKRVSDRVHVV